MSKPTLYAGRERATLNKLAVQVEEIPPAGPARTKWASERGFHVLGSGRVYVLPLETYIRGEKYIAYRDSPDGQVAATPFMLADADEVTLA